MGALHLTSENYNEVTGNGLVLVDYWASWCGPCRMVAPIIEELADEYEDRAIIAKVDIDSEGDIAVRNEIVSIPTVILFKDGVEVKRLVGVQQKSVYTAALEGN